ncbi:hypothetical protein SDC9_37474 [bioreactor metagenome]|uniref:Phage protein n=1 Tax=bioreactor metagenome TaxID=1076179 RepID=A0A644VJB1_9ZZZZ|nr:DUF1799 domain-containing protein [Acidaminococcaceae bacterium]
MSQAHKTAPCEGCENRRPELAPENWETWELWLALRTQWRTASITTDKYCKVIKTGLDYSSLFLVAKTLEIEVTPALLSKIRALESATLSKEGGEK